jgi:hypothetical protein
MRRHGVFKAQPERRQKNRARCRGSIDRVCHPVIIQHEVVHFVAHTDSLQLPQCFEPNLGTATFPKIRQIFVGDLDVLDLVTRRGEIASHQGLSEQNAIHRNDCEPGALRLEKRSADNTITSNGNAQPVSNRPVRIGSVIEVTRIRVGISGACAHSGMGSSEPIHRVNR